MKFPISPQLVEVGTDGAVDEEKIAEEECAVVGDAVVVPLAGSTPLVKVVGAAVWVIICLDASELWDVVVEGLAIGKDGWNP